MMLVVHSRPRPRYMDYEIHLQGCVCHPHGYSFTAPVASTVEAVAADIKTRDVSAYVVVGVCTR